jgi:hypothetical protein
MERTHAQQRLAALAKDGAASAAAHKQDLLTVRQHEAKLKDLQVLALYLLAIYTYILKPGHF